MKTKSRARTKESEMVLAFTEMPSFFKKKTRDGPNARVILGDGEVGLSSQWEKRQPIPHVILRQLGGHPLCRGWRGQ